MFDFYTGVLEGIRQECCPAKHLVRMMASGYAIHKNRSYGQMHYQCLLALDSNPQSADPIVWSFRIPSGTVINRKQPELPWSHSQQDLLVSEVRMSWA